MTFLLKCFRLLQLTNNANIGRVKEGVDSVPRHRSHPAMKDAAAGTTVYDVRAHYRVARSD